MSHIKSANKMEYVRICCFMYFYGTLPFYRFCCIVHQPAGAANLELYFFFSNCIESAQSTEPSRQRLYITTNAHATHVCFSMLKMIGFGHFERRVCGSFSLYEPKKNIQKNRWVFFSHKNQCKQPNYGGKHLNLHQRSCL